MGRLLADRVNRTVTQEQQLQFLHIALHQFVRVHILVNKLLHVQPHFLQFFHPFKFKKFLHTLLEERLGLLLNLAKIGELRNLAILIGLEPDGRAHNLLPQPLHNLILKGADPGVYGRIAQALQEGVLHLVALGRGIGDHDAHLLCHAGRLRGILVAELPAALVYPIVQRVVLAEVSDDGNR